MSSNPRPAKRARRDAGPAPDSSHRPASNASSSTQAISQLQTQPQPQSQQNVPSQQSHQGQAYTQPALQTTAQQQLLPQQQQQHVPQNADQPAAATPAIPSTAPATVFRHVSSVPPNWGPIGIPENMTMTLHEALEILDPFEKMPHDLYSVLAYASVAHPDVGKMLDRFARTQREATIAELERIREYTEAARLTQLAATEAGVSGRFVPIDDLDLPRPAGAIPLQLPEKPRALIEMDQKAEAARKAKEAVDKRRLAAERKTLAKREKTSLSSTVKPGQDKDFVYLVRKAEEELGWTGKYDPEKDPKPKYSRAALRKEVSFWLNKSTDVRDNLKWMQKQLIKEVEIKSATFGTKRNAIFASMEILRAVVVDESEIGSNLREFSLDGLATNFKKMVLPLTQEERDMLRDLPKGKFVKDLKKLIQQLRKQKLQYAVIESALLLVDPEAKIPRSVVDYAENSSESGDEGSSETESSSEEGEGEEEEDAAGEEEDAAGDVEEGEEDEEEESSEEDEDAENEDDSD